MNPHATYAFADRTTVASGSAVRLRVRTGARRFGVVLTRYGSRLERHVAASFDAEPADADDAFPERWPAYDVPLSGALRSGVYVAEIVTDDGTPAGVGIDARSGAALFVVRSPARARILLNLPLFTYHAYGTGCVDPRVPGTCLYNGAETVSLARPGGGIGGEIWDSFNADAYDGATPRQSFEHWDGKALAWLEARGHVVDACTDLDLHEDPNALADRSLLLCFGHHEYWSDAMRANVDRFLDAGGNVGFFSGNTLWFRVAYDARTRSIRRIGAWPVPESLSTGLTYARGAGWWRGARVAAGYTVRDARHWAFAGTGLRDGDAFGADERLIGYECDGIDPGAAPAGLRELASCDTAAWPVPAGAGDVFAEGRASFVAFERPGGGTVVNAGTVDWPRLLERNAIVARITENVVTHLGDPLGRNGA